MEWKGWNVVFTEDEERFNWFLACREGDVETLKNIHAKHPTAFTWRSELERHTALHVAAEAEKAEVLEYLIQAKGEINATDKVGCTPLMLAARHGKLASVMLLLLAGAQPDIESDTSLKARDYALLTGHSAVVKVIDRHVSGLPLEDFFEGLHTRVSVPKQPLKLQPRAR